MTGRDRANRTTHLLLTGVAAALVAAALPPAPAQAFWVGVGTPFPGWGYAPAPYYAYPPQAYYAPPGYYAPPSGYYAPPGAPPPSAYAPAAPAAPAYPPSSPASSAYAPSAAAAMYEPPAASTGAPTPLAPTAQATPAISYTSKPAFTNGAGQTCREYKASDGGRDVFGTACRQADGQWRVVN